MSGFLVFEILGFYIEISMIVNQSPDSYRGWFELIACPDPYREGGAKSLTEMSGFLVFDMLGFYMEISNFGCFLCSILKVCGQQKFFPYSYPLPGGVAEGPL